MDSALSETSAQLLFIIYCRTLGPVWSELTQVDKSWKQWHLGHRCQRSRAFWVLEWTKFCQLLLIQLTKFAKGWQTKLSLSVDLENVYTSICSYSKFNVYNPWSTAAFSYAFVSILNAAIRIADIIFSCLTFFVVNLLFSWGKNVERFPLWTTRKPQVWHILDLKRERDSFEINSALLLALPSFLSHACWRLQAWVAWSTEKVCFSLAGLQHAS